MKYKHLNRLFIRIRSAIHRQMLMNIKNRFATCVDTKAYNFEIDRWARCVRRCKTMIRLRTPRVHSQDKLNIPWAQQPATAAVQQKRWKFHWCETIKRGSKTVVSKLWRRVRSWREKKTEIYVGGTRRSTHHATSGIWKYRWPQRKVS